MHIKINENIISCNPASFLSDLYSLRKISNNFAVEEATSL